MVLDSLKYWTNVMGADGFRFDLAAVLGNADSEGGYSFNRDDPNNILNRAVVELPARPAAGGLGVDLIAEPYTAFGQDGQQQGNFPVGWSEWNDRFRDVFRASQNKLGFVPVTPGAIATRFAGSDDLFGPRGRGPMELHQLHRLPRRLHTARSLFIQPAQQHSTLSLRPFECWSQRSG
jgi:glycogen operon protein